MNSSALIAELISTEPNKLAVKTPHLLLLGSLCVTINPTSIDVFCQTTTCFRFPSCPSTGKHIKHHWRYLLLAFCWIPEIEPSSPPPPPPPLLKFPARGQRRWMSLWQVKQASFQQLRQRHRSNHGNPGRACQLCKPGDALFLLCHYSTLETPSPERKSADIRLHNNQNSHDRCSSAESKYFTLPF